MECAGLPCLQGCLSSGFDLIETRTELLESAVRTHTPRMHCAKMGPAPQPPGAAPATPPRLPGSAAQPVALRKREHRARPHLFAFGAGYVVTGLMNVLEEEGW